MRDILGINERDGVFVIKPRRGVVLFIQMEVIELNGRNLIETLLSGINNQLIISYFKTSFIKIPA